MPAYPDDPGESEAREPAVAAASPASDAPRATDPPRAAETHRAGTHRAGTDRAGTDGAGTDGAGTDGAGTGRQGVARRGAGKRGAARSGRGRPAPLVLAATVTTTWAALVTFVPTLIIVGFAYAIDGEGVSVSRVLRLGLGGWLLAHGVPLRLGHGTIGLVPLAVSVFIAWRVGRAGVHTARAVGARRFRSVLPTLTAGAAVGAAYSLIGAAAAAMARMPGMEISVPRAALTLAGYGLVAGSIGAAAESRKLSRAVAALPKLVVDGVRAGVVAALLILGAGGALAGMSIALDGGRASQYLSVYETGVVGQAGLTFVCLVYSPNAAVWAASYLVGPGFEFGTGSRISVVDVTRGPEPTVPALAGMPEQSVPVWASVLLLGLPLAAALTSGWLLARRAGPPAARSTTAASVRFDWRPWAVLVATGALAGIVSGALLGLVSLASSGSLGSERMADIGPLVMPVALIGAGVVAIGVIVAAGAYRLLARPVERVVRFRRR